MAAARKKDIPIASLSLDLDNQWSYMKVHGDQGWEDYPSYLPIFVPHVLEVLKHLECTITFFVVGKDAEIALNKPYLQQIVKEGHEIGNHSYQHESWLKTYGKSQIETELDNAEEAIIAATGQRPRGFRGPGFSWSPELIESLIDRGYSYDASTLPTYLGPLARKYYFMTSSLSKEERKERSELFGTFSDGLRPVKPYKLMLDNSKNILEIPVSTIPIIKTPFHFSYLLYLSTFSMTLMRSYLQLAIMLCKLTRTTPSYLLHPLDMIGGDQIPQLDFFPGMNIRSSRKLEVFTIVIETLKKHYQFVPMGVHADWLNNGTQRLRRRPLS